ncbi:AMP-binding protein [Streptomyces griseoluteus]|uniref:AMP-binding protein n=1 Tax=Streptomyces griseoluteus TaxID=29306 RepID=UPI0036584DCE
MSTRAGTALLVEVWERRATSGIPSTSEGPTVGRQPSGVRRTDSVTPLSVTGGVAVPRRGRAGGGDGAAARPPRYDVPRPSASWPPSPSSPSHQVLYGGCQTSPARIADAVRRLGPGLTQGYGQDEAGLISVPPPKDHDPDAPALLRTAGKILPGVDVEIRDADGNVLPDGERGEIRVRSDMVMHRVLRSLDCAS